MIALFAALLLSQLPPNAQPPTDARLDAFRAACAPHRQDLVATAEMMAADGWVPADDADHPELASTMANARAGAVDPELQMTADFTVWKKAFGDQTFYVVLNRADAVMRAEDRDDDGDGVIQDWEKRDVMTLLGCGLWDFEATGPMDPDAVTAWVGAGPVQVIDEPTMVQGGTWSVYHLMPGTGEVHVGFIPVGGLGYDRAGFSGLSLTMTSAPKRDAEAAGEPDLETDPAAD